MFPPTELVESLEVEDWPPVWDNDDALNEELLAVGRRVVLDVDDDWSILIDEMLLFDEPLPLVEAIVDPLEVEDEPFFFDELLLLSPIGDEVEGGE